MDLKLLLSAKSFFLARQNRLNSPRGVQPLSLPLFLPNNTNNDEQRYAFYRTADVWSAVKFAGQAKNPQNQP